MASELTYLKEIADNIKSIAKGSTSEQAKLQDISAQIKVSTDKQAASDKNSAAITTLLIGILAKAFLVDVVENEGTANEQTVQVSLFKQIYDLLDEALHVTVTENNASVKKSVAQLLQEIRTEQENIRKSLDGTTANGVSARMNTMNGKLETISEALIDDSGQTPVTVLSRLSDVANAIQTGDGNIVTALGTTNTTLGNIQTNTREAADNLYDTATNRSMTGILKDTRSYIYTTMGYANNIKNSAANIDTNTQNINVTVTPSDIANGIDASDLASDVTTIKNNSNRADDKLALIQGGVASIDGKIS